MQHYLMQQQKAQSKVVKEVIIHQVERRPKNIVTTVTEEPSAEIDEKQIEVKTRSIFDQPKESKVSLVTAN